MFSSSRLSRLALAVTALAQLATAHINITYPGSRGYNLDRSGPDPQNDPDSIGIDYQNGTFEFPYGRQFTYPCGGLPMTPKNQSRPYWPIGGGAVALAPGVGAGFKTSYIYINIGIAQPGELAPRNYSHALTPPLAVSGVNASTWHGQMCVAQTAMPTGMEYAVGDNATIQVVQVAATGEAVYSCADITFAPNGDSKVASVDAQSCYNSTDISLSTIFTATGLS